MRTMLHGAVASLCLIVSVCAIAGTTPQAHQLPQAQPGAAYNTQLSIPVGVIGYPFTCQLLGDALPAGLTFDCATFRFQGSIPAGNEQTYSLTLKLVDAQGNTATIPLLLPVSSNPIMVSLDVTDAKTESATDSASPGDTVTPQPPAAQKTQAPAAAPGAPVHSTPAPKNLPGNGKPATTGRDAGAGGNRSGKGSNAVVQNTHPQTTAPAPDPVATPQPATRETPTVQREEDQPISAGGAKPAPAPANKSTTPVTKAGATTVPAGNPDIKDGLIPGSTVLTLTEPASATPIPVQLEILRLPGNTACDPTIGQALWLQGTGTEKRKVVNLTLGETSITPDVPLNDPLTANEWVCAYQLAGDAKTPGASPAHEVKLPFKLRITGTPKAGDTTISLVIPPQPAPAAKPAKAQGKAEADATGGSASTDASGVPMATGPSYSVYQVADLSQQADLSKQQADADRSAQDASKQVTENTRYCGPDNGMPLALANSGDKGGGAIYSTQLTTDKTTGAASIGLANPLQSDTYICVAQVPTTAQVVPSNARLVIDPFDLGRVRLYFTSGVLVANDDATAQNTTGSSFSTAHTFLALTMDSDFLLPGCYLRIYANHTDTGICEHKRNVYGNTFRPPPLGNPRNQDDIANLNGTHVPPPPPGTNTWFTPYGWWGRHHPGVNQFFEARLTAIPVSSTSTPSTNTPTTPTTGTSLRFASSPGGGLSLNGAAAAPAATSASSGTSTSSFLTTQTTARLDAGVYFPILLTRWDWGGDANSLFFAPLTKIGFDTLTGPTSQTVTAANGMGTTTLSLENLYKFDGFGARIGHMSLTKTNRHAPETLSYLDVTIGRFSNLNSYICHPSATTSMLTGSSCVAQYGAGNYADSLKRMYRVDFEGLLKVPKTPLVLGFNANIGQEEIGAQKLDHAFQPPDDLRFLFGTKLDLSTLLSKINLGSASQKK